MANVVHFHTNTQKVDFSCCVLIFAERERTIITHANAAIVLVANEVCLINRINSKKKRKAQPDRKEAKNARNICALKRLFKVKTVI